MKQKTTSLLERVASCPFWSEPVSPEPLGGGITNTNFIVKQAGQRYVVRVGNDIPVHGVMRFHELAAGQAAFQCGLSPEIVHTEPGMFVMRCIEGKTLTQADVCQQPYLEQIVPLLHRCHRDVGRMIRGPVLFFWVFHVIRDYAARLQENHSRMIPRLPEFLQRSEAWEHRIGAIDVVFGHNDLLPANILDDGTRLWLIDWDYAGFGSPLFDLANLASNNLLHPTQEQWLLEHYFERPVDGELWRRYSAMKCASLLREAMWSMVSEIYSVLDFDYVAYTDENLKRYEAAYADFLQL